MCANANHCSAVGNQHQVLVRTVTFLICYSYYLVNTKFSFLSARAHVSRLQIVHSGHNLDLKMSMHSDVVKLVKNNIYMFRPICSSGQSANWQIGQPICKLRCTICQLSRNLSNLQIVVAA